MNDEDLERLRRRFAEMEKERTRSRKGPLRKIVFAIAVKVRRKDQEPSEKNRSEARTS